MSSDSASMPAGKFGFLESAVMKLLARPAVVSDVQVLTAHFRLITLQGDALKGADWVPGQKVQMQFGGFVSRTFTPIAWDAAKGETRLVGFSHGDGPGARWVVGAKPGDACVVFGPRRSLDVGSVPRPALFFGDETSFGLA
ncbi:MAG: siderophore-interacting protein, partial [Burkholderiales bacterium]|nr:siderophore-interacting protein [Burkholderiales bacterium]